MASEEAVQMVSGRYKGGGGGGGSVAEEGAENGCMAFDLGSVSVCCPSSMVRSAGFSDRSVHKRGRVERSTTKREEKAVCTEAAEESVAFEISRADWTLEGRKAGDAKDGVVVVEYRMG